MKKTDSIIEFASDLEYLSRRLGKKKEADQAARAGMSANATIGSWNHIAFTAAYSAVHRLLDSGLVAEAVAAADRMLRESITAGEKAYGEAAYDIARAYYARGRTRKLAKLSDVALQDLLQAEQRFRELSSTDGVNATLFVSVARGEQADCMRDLGLLDESAEIYLQLIQECATRGDLRNRAVVLCQLGTVRRRQGLLSEALVAYIDARTTFDIGGELAQAAVCWHQIGNVHSQIGETDPAELDLAERAYQEALRIMNQLKDRAGQADTLGQLGCLYDSMGKYEEAVRFLQEAVEIYVESGDLAGEGRARNNIAEPLIRLGRLDRARTELKRAIVCAKPFGHSAEPWRTFELLKHVEMLSRNIPAAMEASRKALAARSAYRDDGGQRMD